MNRVSQGIWQIVINIYGKQTFILFVMAKDTPSKLYCRLCDLKCKSKISFLSHLETHVGAPMSCISCQLTFNNVYSMRYHKVSKLCTTIHRKSGETPGCSVCRDDEDKRKHCSQCKKLKKPKTILQCFQCNKTFHFRLHYNNHVEGHKRNNCRYCSALLANRKELVLHMAEKHKIKLLQAAGFKCKFCDKRFVKRLTLYRHFKEHANGQLVCLSCGSFVKTKEDLSAHEEKHNKERKWRCDRCKQTFMRRQQYLVHMKDHEKYRCTLCGEDFALKRMLAKHKRLIHHIRSMERPHQCSVCGRSFIRPGQLELHCRIHTGEWPLGCKQCNKSFRTPRRCMEHKCPSKHHSEGYPTSKCEQCNKCFDSIKTLEKHVRRVHSSVKNFQCEFCHQAFKCKENMKRHLALHTESRQFVCEVCGAAFRALNTLLDHNKYVHSQTRQFTCAKCGKCFKRNSGLNRHMSTHSDTRPFVCECGQSYKRASHLNRHKESLHGKRSQGLVQLGHDAELHWQVPSNETVANSIQSLTDVPTCPSGNADVMRDIEVVYNLNSYPSSEALTVVSGAESQLLFTSPVSGDLDPSHTILTLHSEHIEATHNSQIDNVKLQPILNTGGILQYSTNICIGQDKMCESSSSLCIPNDSDTTLLPPSENVLMDLDSHPRPIQPNMLEDSASRYPLVSEFRNYTPLLPPSQNEFVNLDMLPRPLQSNSFDDSTPSSPTTLPEYLPRHYSYLNVLLGISCRQQK